MDANDESNLTEIEILPDGRICVFGMSAEVLAVVNDLRLLEADRLATRQLVLESRPAVPTCAQACQIHRLPAEHLTSQDDEKQS